MTVVGSPIAGKLSARHGPRALLVAGPLAIGGGLLLLSGVDADASYLTDVAPGVLVMGAGLATMVAPLTASVLAAAATDDVGIASAVNNAVARVASLLATALLPAAAGITGAVGGAEFARGYERALVISAALCVIGSAVAAVAITRCVRTHTSQQVSVASGCTQVSVPEPAAATAG